MTNLINTNISFPFATTTISLYSPYHIHDYNILYAGTPAQGQATPLCKGYLFTGFLTVSATGVLFFMNRDVLVNAGALPAVAMPHFLDQLLRGI
jgi:hypothetical protein